MLNNKNEFIDHSFAIILYSYNTEILMYHIFKNAMLKYETEF